MRLSLEEALDGADWWAPTRRALFGTEDAAFAARLVREFADATVGRIDGVRFAHAGTGIVLGLDLVDGVTVVLKVLRWNATVERLRAVQAVQSWLADHGMPAPRPLAGAAALGGAVATIEEYVPGRGADGHAAEVRATLAAGLAEFVETASALAPSPAVGANVLLTPEPGGIWQEPHDVRFDFEATRVGAEWIDDLARHARAELAACELPDVVAHLDWRIDNVGFDGTALVAIYDWDSVGRTPEAVAVGQASAQFSTSWLVGAATLPAIDEMRRFVDDYASHRGPFDETERRAVDASNLLLCAYGARCQHSDLTLHPELAGPPDAGWLGLLRARADRGLFESTAAGPGPEPTCSRDPN
ncbi:MAG TPA: hypothetical protein VK853_01855 [Ilumatobacteraceae bacterium]|nr:hypothetical protein [Ilumatobacteraceae bacterium]